MVPGKRRTSTDPVDAQTGIQRPSPSKKVNVHVYSIPIPLYRYKARKQRVYESSRVSMLWICNFKGVNHELTNYELRRTNVISPSFVKAWDDYVAIPGKINDVTNTTFCKVRYVGQTKKKKPSEKTGKNQAKYYKNHVCSSPSLQKLTPELLKRSVVDRYKRSRHGCKLGKWISLDKLSFPWRSRVNFIFINSFSV